MDTQLFDFTRRALAKGKTKAEISAALMQAGWMQESIQSALDAFADVDFVVPVPRPKPYFSAREAFLYLVMFSAYYCAVYHIGSLLFEVVDKYFPDPAMTEYVRRAAQDAIRWSVSTLIVSLPVFLYTFRLLNNDIRREPQRRGSRVRKWLTYLTLFIAAMTLMVDGGYLINDVLAGEITVRFVLKVLVVAVLAGGSFLYFLREMRNEENA